MIEGHNADQGVGVIVRCYRLLLLAGIPAFAALTNWSVLAISSPSARAQETAPAPASFKFLGAGSCASMACHNSQGPPGATGSEYTTWAAHDLHARAVDVLYDERSVRMTKYLRRGKPAPQDPLCLKCHVNPNYSESLPVVDLATFRGDGVSCETCHGPAEKYVSEHYKQSWKSLTAQEKKNYGMRDLKPLPNRIAMCVECHIGAKESDVNHDLIAAGHPRLNFEFTSFHGAWARHWPDRNDRDPKFGGQTDFEIRAWSLGQLTCAKTALEILAERASNNTKPWPEFAEYDCYACHHDLVKDSWRQKLPGGNKGVVPWSRWYDSQLVDALPADEAEKSAALKEAIVNLRKLMEAEFGRSDRARVEGLAHNALSALEPLQLATLKLRPPNLDGLYHKLLEQESAGSLRCWDEAAQSFLTYSALERAFKDRSEAPAFLPELKTNVNRLRRELTFPPHFDSPKSFRPLGGPKR